MSNFADSAKTIRDRFKTLVATPKSLQVQYDNLPFTRPENALYVRFQVRYASSQRVSVGAPGANRFRVTGIWIASIFDLIDNGEKVSVELADFMAGAFITLGSYQGVHFRAPEVFKVGRAGKYWQTNVTCEWYSDFLQ